MLVMFLKTLHELVHAFEISDRLDLDYPAILGPFNIILGYIVLILAS